VVAEGWSEVGNLELVSARTLRKLVIKDGDEFSTEILEIAATFD
jgi:hypothetical protein